MKMYLNLFLTPVLSLLLWGNAAVAADKTDGVSSSIAVAKVICEKHFVASDVAFQSGVDVDGNVVVPADLAPSPVPAPEYLEVPLSVDLGKAMNIPLGDGVETEAVVGNLKLYNDGRVEYNGQDISENVASFCGVDTRKNPEPPASVRVVPETKPEAGSVASSMTVEPPKPKAAFDLPRSTVNMSR
ncbi:MAG: hypothetical protein IAE63_05515 [Alphaproteobacteria bacterium]|nr:hypothetical protein [Alphaproteobacteria bacterium]